MRFESKKDTWLSVILFISMFVTLVGSGALLRELLMQEFTGMEQLWMMILLLILVASVFFIYWIYTGTYYVLNEDSLFVRSGPFKWDIDFAKIKSISPSNNPLSGPALSLDRLSIELHESRVPILISPEDKAGFLEALYAFCPQLEKLDASS